MHHLTMGFSILIFSNNERLFVCASEAGMCSYTALVFLVRSQKKRTKKAQLQCMYRQLPKFTHTRERTHAQKDT